MTDPKSIDDALAAMGEDTMPILAVVENREGEMFFALSTGHSPLTQTTEIYVKHLDMVAALMRHLSSCYGVPEEEVWSRVREIRKLQDTYATDETLYLNRKEN